MNSHIPPKIFDQHLITHRKRYVIKPILILIAVVAVTIVLFKLATFTRPATAAGPLGASRAGPKPARSCGSTYKALLQRS